MWKKIIAFLAPPVVSAFIAVPTSYLLIHPALESNRIAGAFLIGFLTFILSMVWMVIAFPTQYFLWSRNFTGITPNMVIPGVIALLPTIPLTAIPEIFNAVVAEDGLAMVL